jgi:nicotinamidase-related amidase
MSGNPDTLPKTLLEMAGAVWPKAAFEDAVLVIIDAQREYLEGAVPLHGIEAAIDEAAAVLAMARKHATPVFHIVHHAPRGSGAFAEGAPLTEIVPALAPKSEEAIIAKNLPNAFAGTDLAERIRATGRSDVIITGFMTHMCVSASARAALDLGFRTTVVAAATGTRALPDPLGGAALTAEAVHKTALAELADRFATITPNAAALAAKA